MNTQTLRKITKTHKGENVENGENVTKLVNKYISPAPAPAPAPAPTPAIYNNRPHPSPFPT